MKSLIGLLAVFAYMGLVWGVLIMHVWGVVEVWQYTRGSGGFLLFVCSIFTLLITEVFMFFQHVNASGWLGSPYAIAGTIHLTCLGIVLVSYPFIKNTSSVDSKKESEGANKLGLNDDEFEEFMRIGRMSPAELFALDEDGGEDEEEETVL